MQNYRQIKFNNTSKISIYHDQFASRPGILGWFNTHKFINTMQQINRNNDKNHMIMSIDTEKTFEKIKLPFIIKRSKEAKNRRNVP
jgi:hypothetical protein